MTDLGPWYAARDIVRRALEDDLLGGPEQDVIDERPLDRFIIGILHPLSSGDAGTDVDAGAVTTSRLEEEADDPEPVGGTAVDAVFDPAIALSRVRYPSSLGLTFAVDLGVSPVVDVDVSAARYVEEATTGAAEERAEDVRHRGRADGPAVRWRRHGTTVPTVAVDARIPGSFEEELTEGLSLRTVVRPAVDGSVSVTVVVLNTSTHSSGAKDPLCWFQPVVRVRAAGGFLDRPSTRPTGVDDEDLDAYELLFRDTRNLAVGHGCAVDWEDAPVVPVLTTTFVPRFDLRLSEARGAAGLEMGALSSTSDLAPLRALVADYREWVRLRREEAQALSGGLRSTAERHLRDADTAAGRMAAGLDLLEVDPDARRAFSLMNAAMEEQRSRQEAVRARAAGRQPEGRKQSWRPFQIAFILINLPSLTDPASEERDLADLLWFPTGGGKTEAYLGLIAYTILLRRIRSGTDGGVSVLMRYTLRLLTLQQFERAAGLVCALELSRRRELPATQPISLGLWVGQGAAPNNVKDAQKALRRLARGEATEEGNPVQLIRCPWCGVPFDHQQYLIDRAVTRMTVRCADAACDFADALPVHLVDEDVYRERPSLVIGTVDKFAMMAWRGEVATLFSTDGAHPPPDLIVQDELHLISGPLGTMVGLYETAVDVACTGRARPKIVASTATIRRAAQQVRAVFDRTAVQFPPPGLEARDSYFAIEAAPEEKGTRQYVGLLAPGVSQATLLVRTYAALLQGAADLDAPDEVKDAYWTLLGYFNSLRLLGGAFMQVIDDVPDRIGVVAERAGSRPRQLAEPRELTSRKKSSEIPVELDLLGRSLPDAESPDVVLATNMISVGVDVDRLGLMAVMGQPQTTAEYIQSTSRVGRRHPGLVLVMYNAARSRDLSHYESFATYHRSLYRQVEATGATPFAARARDRGLHGVLVALARMLIPAARPDRAAGSARAWEAELRTVGDHIVRRSEAVSPDEGAAVRREVDRLVDAWLDLGGPREVKYAGWFDPTDALLVPAGSTSGGEEWSFPVDDPPWATLSSLRDVDAESWVYLIPSHRRRTHGDT